MATGKRFYWIKLRDSFMASDAVDFLMSQKDGANYVVLYQMLCLKTINTDGRLSRRIGEVIIPYDEAKIARDCKWFSIDTVRIALNLYKALGLIYIDEDGSLVMAEHEEMVGSETDWKSQKKSQRAKRLPKLNECQRLNANTIRLPSGKSQYVDEKRYGGNGMKAFDLAGGKCEICGSFNDLLIHHANGYSNEQEDLYVLCERCHGTAHAASTPKDWLHHTWVKASNESGQDSGQEGGHVHTENRDKEIRDKETTSKEVAKKEEIQKVVDAWNTLKLPKVRKLLPNTERYQSLSARLSEYGTDDVLEAIEKVRASRFLNGKNDHHWQASFDWFVRPNKFPKILEGCYDDGQEDFF